MSKTVVFYEINPNGPSNPEFQSEHEQQTFDAINNEGAIDQVLLTKRNRADLLTLSRSLDHLLDTGAIERRTVEVSD